MARTYGLPYCGSKNKIAEWVVGCLPSAPVLVDAFFGGGAISHCAALSGKYGRIVANDRLGTPEFFLRCVRGEYTRGKPRWVSRKEFFDKKDSDLFTRLVWSYGCHGTGYLYTPSAEPLRRAIHYAVVHDGWWALKGISPYYPYTTRAVAAMQGLTAVEERRRAMQQATGERMIPLERINRISGLAADAAALSCIEPHAVDYRELEIPENAVVYCDPPYEGVDQKAYRCGTFDTDAFLEWCVALGKRCPVYVSEYLINDPRFELVSERPRRSTPAPVNRGYTTEHLYRVR